MVTHSNIPSWEIPWTEKSSSLQSMGLQRVRHDGARAHTHTHTPYMHDIKPTIPYIFYIYIYIYIYIHTHIYIYFYIVIRHGFLSSVRDFDNHVSTSHVITSKCCHKPEELHDMKYVV